jgi:flagellar biosynthesis protein FlhB
METNVRYLVKFFSLFVEAIGEMLPRVVNNVRSIRVGDEKNWEPIDFIEIKTVLLIFLYLLMVCCIVLIIEILSNLKL